ncbi:efflux RND transporter periplasmic adaptor subunit [uncultured Arcticibacterium sp.]|uniref:efflux RND transporter periplasmic adaptor subunit n=1 Tax=uncultured Arcticibacterium sp. TaxID=2173042 RepID=UPI0030F813D1
MKKYAYLLITIATLSFIGFSCGQKEATSIEGKKAQLAELQTQASEIGSKIDALKAEIGILQPEAEKKVSQVKAMPLSAQDFSHYVEANGRLDAVNNVFVSPQMGGALTRVFVKEGDYVKKGQTIATIDNSILRNSINEVKIQLETAKTIFGRQEALWNQKIGTEIQYIQAKAQVENLEKRLLTMNAQDAQNTVVAPIAGYVDEVRMKAGEMASPGLGIVRIVNLSDLKVVVNIPDTYAGTIQKGDLVKVKFPDLGKEITARLSFVSQTVNQISRTFTAEAKVPFDKQLKPNLNAMVEIQDQARSSALVIPQNLIQRTELGDIVYVAETEGENQVARGKAVTTGLSYNGQIEVLTGLTAGDILITDGYQEIVDGELVSY